MSKPHHPTQDELMDFVDGDVIGGEAANLEGHLAECEACRGHVESLKSTLAALERDAVPQPPEAYFAFLADQARRRARAGRRHLLFRFAPGLAAAAAAVVLMWWVTRLPFSHVDGLDIIMADMTTGEIVETVSLGPYAGRLFTEGTDARLNAIETYLLDTENIYELLESMSQTERTRFMSYLEGSMTDDRESSGLMSDPVRKEC